MDGSFSSKLKNASFVEIRLGFMFSIHLLFKKVHTFVSSQLTKGEGMV